MSCVKFSVERDVFQDGICCDGQTHWNGRCGIHRVRRGNDNCTGAGLTRGQAGGLMVTPIGVGDAPFVDVADTEKFIAAPAALVTSKVCVAGRAVPNW